MYKHLLKHMQCKLHEILRAITASIFRTQCKNPDTICSEMICVTALGKIRNMSMENGKLIGVLFTVFGWFLFYQIGQPDHLLLNILESSFTSDLFFFLKYIIRSYSHLSFFFMAIIAKFFSSLLSSSPGVPKTDTSK